VWAETQLALRDAYEKRIYGLAEAGKLGWSSGTAAHLVKREPVGGAMKIMHWPLGLDASLTPTPAEPRNTVVALKAWAPEASIVIDGEQADSENIESQTVTPAVQFSGVTIMTENVKTVDQKVDELSAVVDRILKYVEDTPALKNVGYVSGTGGKSDSNLKSFADFLTAIARKDTTRLHGVYGSTKASDLTTATGEFGIGGRFCVVTSKGLESALISVDATRLTLSRYGRRPGASALNLSPPPVVCMVLAGEI
jgi:hypothetical protein